MLMTFVWILQMRLNGDSFTSQDAYYFLKKKLRQWLRNITLLGKSLKEILKTDEVIEQIEELIGQIYAFKNRNEE